MRSVSELMDAAEEADDEYRDAVTSTAEARARYEYAYHVAFASADGSVSARVRDAESEARAEHAEWLACEAVEKASKTHVQVLLGLLVAAQSVQKFAGKQDGGTDWGDF